MSRSLMKTRRLTRVFAVLVVVCAVIGILHAQTLQITSPADGIKVA